jgi:tetratricopeptide (TPR) repeat protein
MQRTTAVHRMLVSTLLAAGLLAAGPAQADLGGSSSSASAPPPIEKAMDALKDENYKKATRYLKRHLKKNPDDADALNMMGYSLRKLEDFEDSEEYYLRALEIEPEHLGANEYLGELYLQTGRPELARERLAVLEKACPDSCAERKDLDDALARYTSSNGP